MKQSNSTKITFIKYHTCLSYMFSPSETRFILHMIEIEYIKSCGYNTDWSRAEYRRRMGLSEYSFDQCVKKLHKIKLLDKEYNSLGNKVYYSFNIQLYNKLIEALSEINDLDKLIDFCSKFKSHDRTIESITPEEIEHLSSKKKFEKVLPSDHII